MLQIDPSDVKAFDVDKATQISNDDKEYIYLTKDLGWKERMKGEFEEEERKCDPKDVPKLSEYLFLTK